MMEGAAGKVQLFLEISWWYFLQILCGTACSPLYRGEALRRVNPVFSDGSCVYLVYLVPTRVEFLDTESFPLIF